MNIPDYLNALREELRNHKALGLDEQAHQVEAEIKRVEAEIKRSGGGKEKAVPAAPKETAKDDS